MAMTLRLDDESQAALDLLAEQDGISKQEAVRRAIVESASRRHHRATVAALGERGIERYRDLLDRLGQ
ncbi:ribbon-helix-helix protein, CopG family [Serinibacter salmoneus]|uniref:Ribbon-helix-helix CopG family protein n=1 Tax=Serinibacter salmoneus TaxID=556530 RepID=A0A2A9D2V7_9MICO|nr:ribbon-helix-helix protein, CopG family [Serinibacter salmoneus]PFG20676.1 ribbon-helix-helix CopG family protein [Serinibacter salmoneus]